MLQLMTVGFLWFRRRLISDFATVIYNMYLQLGVDGLRGLENYDPTTNVSCFLNKAKWN